MQALRFTRCIFCRTCTTFLRTCLRKVFRRSNGRAVWKWLRPGVIIDGAHNEDGIAQFVSTAGYFAKENEITILFTAVADKHYHEMIGEICEGIHPSHVVATQIDGSRVVPAEVLAEDFRKADARCLRGTGDRGSV